MGCKSKRSKCGKNIRWEKYPSLEKAGYGHGKFCYFISCRDSKYPIRDYKRKPKPKFEPYYENKSYNECASCNQSGIKNAYDRGISYIIFYTKYQGKEERYRNRYFITGLFPISAQRRVGDRNAYRSNNPVFLSIEDSKELNDETWRDWFGRNLPKDRRGAHNLHFMAKFVDKEKNKHALVKILDYFKKKEDADKNKIKDYIKAIRSYESEENQ